MVFRQGPMLLFVMAYHNEKEFEAFQFVLDHWPHLVEMHSPFEFLFVDSIGRQIDTSYRHRLLHYKDPQGEPKSVCVGLGWAHVAKHIAEEVDCTCWFWWEPDVLPVKKDCFEFFMRLWTAQCQIMGYRVRDNLYGMRDRINGVAFYCKDYWRYMEPYFDSKRSFDQNRPFDRRTPKSTFVELNKWYCLVHHESLLLTSRIRLVHGIKDHTLRDQVVNGAHHYRPVSRLHRAIRNGLKIGYVNLGLADVVGRWSSGDLGDG